MRNAPLLLVAVVSASIGAMPACSAATTTGGGSGVSDGGNASDGAPSSGNGGGASGTACDVTGTHYDHFECESKTCLRNQQDRSQIRLLCLSAGCQDCECAIAKARNGDLCSSAGITFSCAMDGDVINVACLFP